MVVYWHVGNNAGSTSQTVFTQGPLPPATPPALTPMPPALAPLYPCCSPAASLLRPAAPAPAAVVEVWGRPSGLQPNAPWYGSSWSLYCCTASRWLTKSIFLPGLAEEMFGMYCACGSRKEHRSWEGRAGAKQARQQGMQICFRAEQTYARMCRQCRLGANTPQEHQRHPCCPALMQPRPTQDMLQSPVSLPHLAVRVKQHQVPAADEAGNVCQVVDGVEADAGGGGRRGQEWEGRGRG